MSNAQWNLLLQMCIMCGHPGNWIQFAFNPILGYLWTVLYTFLAPVVARVVASHEMAHRRRLNGFTTKGQVARVTLRITLIIMH